MDQDFKFVVTLYSVCCGFPATGSCTVSYLQISVDNDQNKFGGVGPLLATSPGTKEFWVRGRHRLARKWSRIELIEPWHQLKKDKDRRQGKGRRFCLGDRIYSTPCRDSDWALGGIWRIGWIAPGRFEEKDELNLFVKIVLVQNTQRGNKVNKFFPSTRNDDLCLCFCLYIFTKLAEILSRKPHCCCCCCCCCHQS